jgi:hypothetical protein
MPCWAAAPCQATAEDDCRHIDTQRQHSCLNATQLAKSLDENTFEARAPLRTCSACGQIGHAGGGLPLRMLATRRCDHRLPNHQPGARQCGSDRDACQLFPDIFGKVVPVWCFLCAARERAAGPSLGGCSVGGWVRTVLPSAKFHKSPPHRDASGDTISR